MLQEGWCRLCRPQTTQGTAHRLLTNSVDHIEAITREAALLLRENRETSPARVSHVLKMERIPITDRSCGTKECDVAYFFTTR